MKRSPLKNHIVDSLWRVVAGTDAIRSATLTGSFSRGGGLEGVSDIDLVLIVDPLEEAVFRGLQHDFRELLGPVLATQGYRLRINPTLGPLKYDAPRTAVLHLMVYSPEKHRAHALHSPFTCLDWQRSAVYRKRRLDEVYPVFALQPHQFLSARRGTRDYLADLEAGMVSFHELRFDPSGCREVKRREPMDIRGRHEFAYHILRFLMRNFVKFLSRDNLAHDDDALLARYFDAFPEGRSEFVPFYHLLQRSKRQKHFDQPIDRLLNTTRGFVEAFERQFVFHFETTAMRHVLFRHGPVGGANEATKQRVFLGNTDVDLAEDAAKGAKPLLEVLNSTTVRQTFVSSRRRTAETIALLNSLSARLPPPRIDPRLDEINYGACEGLTVEQACGRFPGLFAAWSRGEDPSFPGGENSATVRQRMDCFVAEHLENAEGTIAVCTHNVVLRSVVGRLLQMAPSQWHRIQIPHLAPIALVATRRFGTFIDLDEGTQEVLFSDFFLDSDHE